VKVAFRVDASDRMGTGHFARCLTLAEALRERGVQTRFICREHRGHLISLLQQRGMPISVLPIVPSAHTSVPEDYAAWLGATQAEDAAQTMQAIKGEKLDCLVVDNYGIDVEWERKLRPHAGKLMVIDDLANRRHDCDVLLDQNYCKDGRSRYGGLVANTCTLLAGPRYALLRPEYASYRRTLRTHSGQIKKILVSFGGSDLENVTGLALEALSRDAPRPLEVDVVVGANNPHRETLERQAAGMPRTRIHGPLPHLAGLMAQADLAIGACGATTLERMCLGLPTVVISTSGNQWPASEALAEARLIGYAGRFHNVTKDRLAGMVRQLIEAPETLAFLSTQNQLQVDGLGTFRVVEALCPSAGEDLMLRPACADDVVFYYDWANDPEVRNRSIHTQSISWTEHQEWFVNKINSRDSRLFVLEAGGLPVGQIRFDMQAGEARIDYSLDEIVRGRGWGSRLVALGIDRMREAGRLRLCAHVKAGNDASRSIFLRLGFAAAAGGPGESSTFYLDPVGLDER